MEKAEGNIGNNGSREDFSLPEPIVEYDKRLSAENVPYKVELDVEGFSELLRLNGMTEERIKKLKVRVIKSSMLSSLIRGNFNNLSNNITIYTDSIWKEYQKYKKISEKMAEGKMRPWKNTFKDILYTKRLPGYLHGHPSERTLAFADRLITQGITRRLSETLLHESRHAMDRRNIPLQVSRAVLGFSIVGGMGILGFKIGSQIPLTHDPLLDAYTHSSLALGGEMLGYNIFYQFDPFETRARKFGKENKNDPQFRSLVRISPKE